MFFRCDDSWRDNYGTFIEACQAQNNCDVGEAPNASWPVKFETSVHPLGFGFRFQNASLGRQTSGIKQKYRRTS